MMQRTEGVLAVPDPYLEIRGGGAFGPQFGLKIRGAGPPAPPLDPPLFGICHSLFQGETLIRKGLTSPTFNIQCAEHDI